MTGDHQDGAGPGKTGQDKIRQDSTRRGKSRRNETRLGATRRGDARPDGTWQDTTGQDKARSFTWERVTMMAKVIGELDQESMLLEKFLAQQKPEGQLSYLQIEHGTGVKMDAAGKQRLRRSMKRMRIEYSCARNYGVTLAGPALVMPILSTRITRIDSAVRRADRSQRILQEQFFHSLSVEEQKSVLFAGAIFGAIRLAAEQGRMMYRTKGGSLGVPATTVHIELPKFEGRDN